MGCHRTKGLTHAERRERRRQMAVRVKAGEGIAAIASDMLVDGETVRNAAKAAGVLLPQRADRMRKVTAITVGYRSGLTDVVIAASLSVSVSTVKRYRLAEKLTRAGGRPRGVSAKWLGVDWSKNNADIAAQMGVGRERVRQVRRKLGMSKNELHGRRTVA